MASDGWLAVGLGVAVVGGLAVLMSGKKKGPVCSAPPFPSAYRVPQAARVCALDDVQSFHRVFSAVDMLLVCCAGA